MKLLVQGFLLSADATLTFLLSADVALRGQQYPGLLPEAAGHLESSGS
jgi:hypothetical protein